MNEIYQFTQLGATLVVVIFFLQYLSKKDKEVKESYDCFNKTISNHLKHSTQVIKQNSDAMKNVAVNLKELTLYLKNINKETK